MGFAPPYVSASVSALPPSRVLHPHRQFHCARRLLSARDKIPATARPDCRGIVMTSASGQGADDAVIALGMTGLVAWGMT